MFDTKTVSADADGLYLKIQPENRPNNDNSHLRKLHVSEIHRALKH